MALVASIEEFARMEFMGLLSEAYNKERECGFEPPVAMKRSIKRLTHDGRVELKCGSYLVEYKGMDDGESTILLHPEKACQKLS